MKIFVTGGAGFIGSNFLRYWTAKYPKDFITVLDAFTYAGNEATIKDLKKNKQIQWISGDVRDSKVVERAMAGHENIFHFAAETHVDRSIQDSQIFLKTNLLGTQTLLEQARKNKIKKFVFISTDEVYGSTVQGSFSEESPLQPNSPYAVSKAAADLLCKSYWITYQLPVLITRCCNNYGPFHYPEKVIPLFITHLLEGKKIPVYGNGKNVREWIHALDHASAIDAVFRKGKLGEVYNVGTQEELSNISLAKLILKLMDQTSAQIQFVPDRLGHDFRYALNSKKLRSLEWKPKYSFETALQETIAWYRENTQWWKTLKNKSSYQKYHQKQYGK